MREVRRRTFLGLLAAPALAPLVVWLPWRREPSLNANEVIEPREALTGELIPWWPDSVKNDRLPRGCLPCDGSNLAVADYRDLFRVVGHRFDNNTTLGSHYFSLPDLRPEHWIIKT